MKTDLEKFFELDDATQHEIKVKYLQETSLRVKLHQLEKEQFALAKAIDDIKKELLIHPTTCRHYDLTGEYGANTGNWCASDDYYWVDFSCPNCGKRWTEDQSDIRYDKNKRGMVSKEGFLFRKIRK